MERYELNKTLEKFNRQLTDLHDSLDFDEAVKTIDSLQKTMQQDGFWNDQKAAQKVINEMNQLKEKTDVYAKLQQEYADIVTLLELADEENDEATYDLLIDQVKALDKTLDAFEVSVLLSGPYDGNNAIVELHPGAGGTESQDWCEMLYRMYLRYAQRHNFKVETLDYQDGEEAGIKSVTVLIKGKNAFGYLKAERGVHRLVRISPFDSNARRHTSFVSVDVAPEIDDSIAIDIKDEDLKIDVYRSGGAGGQSVNTTDSAVRITHKPSGIVVTCQNERSQIKNRETAMGILKSKLIQEELKRQEEELREIKGEQKDIAWGSQIRSYVFHPYSMVKDHRTSHEVGNVGAVMDGDIDEFIAQYLKKTV